jgi:predicted membrane-bound dolichyl-phosphate-mannose-protein mannosyltransferase
MLLKSSLFLLFIGNIYFSNPVYMGFISAILLLINIFNNKEFKKCLKKMKFLFFFYLGTCLFQLFYLQEGEVIWSFYSFHITKPGFMAVMVNFLRITNLIMISWMINSKGILKGRLKKYQSVIENVMELVPEVFTLLKRRMKLKWFFRYILTRIKIKI